MLCQIWSVFEMKQVLENVLTHCSYKIVDYRFQNGRVLEIFVKHNGRVNVCRAKTIY